MLYVLNRMLHVLKWMLLVLNIILGVLNRMKKGVVSSKHPIGTQRVQRMAYSQRIVAQTMEDEELGDVEMSRLEKLFG